MILSLILVLIRREANGYISKTGLQTILMTLSLILILIHHEADGTAA